MADEQINEISKAKLSKYVKAAGKDNEKSMEGYYKDRKPLGSTVKRMAKRDRGIDKAIGKMTKEELDMADNEQELETGIDRELDEAAAASLKPQSMPSDADPKSKPEAMARVLGALGAMPTDWALDHCKEILAQYEKWKTDAAKGSAESNKATLNMKPSAAKGGGGPSADGSMKQVAGQTKPALWDATKEEVETIFGGESLTEEAQGKISALFEAAVSMRFSLLEAELEEQYETELTAAVAQFIEETTQGLDAYVDYAVEQWITENEVAVVDTLRLENTEEFMDKLKDLFVESYIDVPEERLDIVKEMSDKVVDLESRLDEVLNRNAELEESILTAVQEDTIDAVSEGLTLTDSEKLKTLVENVEFDGDVETYTKKLKVVRESYFKKKAPSANSGSVDTLNESTDGFVETRTAISDPFVAAAAKQLLRTM